LLQKPCPCQLENKNHSPKELYIITTHMKVMMKPLIWTMTIFAIIIYKRTLVLRTTLD